MQNYTVTLEGKTSLFMHQDDVSAADKVEKWKMDPSHRSTKKGDDRFPVWTWKTFLYSDGKQIAIPTANISAALRKAGAEFAMAGAKRKTLKSATQVLIAHMSEYSELIPYGRKTPIQNKEIAEISDDKDFEEHAERVEKLGGVMLDVRRATIGKAKHVRVRPKFLPGYKIISNISLLDETRLDKKVLADIFAWAGVYVGIGDWRPSAPQSPGPHGTFSVSSIEKTK